MSTRTPAYLWPNLLSLDAPLIAILWCALVARAHAVHLPPAALPTLGAAVWCIYVLDRVIDGFFARGDPSTLTARHAFYKRWRFAFLPLALVVAMACFYSAGWHLPAGMALVGLVLSGLVALYLLKVLGNHWRPARVFTTLLLALSGAVLAATSQFPTWFQVIYTALLLALIFVLILRPHQFATPSIFPKEVLCGIVFGIGTFLPAHFYMNGGPIAALREPMVFAFAALCGLNCLGIAVYERSHDAIHDTGAITRHWGSASTAYPWLLAVALVVVAIQLGEDGGSGHWLPVCLCIVASLGLLLFIHLALGNRLSTPALRVAVDAALLTPLIPLLLL